MTPNDFLLKISIESVNISFEIFVVTLVDDSRIRDIHEAGWDHDAEEAVEPDWRISWLELRLGKVCLFPLGTVHSLNSLADLPQDLSAGLAGVPDDDVPEPDQKDWYYGEDVEV